jgi:HPt (histidine-containing phosphotransfer) domain-containing protein
MNSIYEKFMNEMSFDQSKIDPLIQLGKDINEDVVLQLFQTHFETSEVMLKDLDLLFNQWDTVKLSSLLHKLKSSCGMLGLNKMYSFCNTLESALRNLTLTKSEVKQYVDCLHFEYAETKKIMLAFQSKKLAA